MCSENSLCSGLDHCPENLKNIFDYFRRPLCILNDFNFYSGVGGGGPGILIFSSIGLQSCLRRSQEEYEREACIGGRDWGVGSTGVSLAADNGTLMHIRDFSELNSYCCLQRREVGQTAPHYPPLKWLVCV